MLKTISLWFVVIISPYSYRYRGSTVFWLSVVPRVEGYEVASTRRNSTSRFACLAYISYARL